MPSLGLPLVILQSMLILLVIAVTVFKETTVLQRLKRFTSSAARVSALRTSIGAWWLFAIMASALAYPNDLFIVSPAATDMEWPVHNALLRYATTGLLVVAFGVTAVTSVACEFNARLRKKYYKAIQNMQFFLPVTTTERRWWILVSLTAGVCEEIVFRGFLLQFLGGQLHHAWSMGLTNAWLLSSLLFGLGHYYQGSAGVVRAGITGALLGLTAIYSGGLLLPIIVHALVDLAVLCVYRPITDDPIAAQRLIEGCDPSSLSFAAG